ncbi:putative acetyltransferase [Sanguibacter inulinus]|uniref:putative acetyltransferase n=1 Tax=Sanguibacter inulinus TaxID=60922 RepID=UPI001C54F8CB|nr:hypothetical protein [Sanguibacter inulinus]
MTFPTHRTPDDHGPGSPASDDTAAALPTVGPPELSAGSTEQGGSSAGQSGTPARPWESWEPGVRVIVRTRLPEGSSHLYTDVLGTITDRSDEALTIETRTGTVEVRLASVATGKIVPPAPPRRRPREG